MTREASQVTVLRPAVLGGSVELWTGSRVQRMWCLFPWAFAFCHAPGPPRAGFWYARRARHAATRTAIAVVSPGELLLAPGLRTPADFNMLVVDKTLVAGLRVRDARAAEGLQPVAAVPVIDDAALATTFGDLLGALTARTPDRVKSNELLRAFIARALTSGDADAHPGAAMVERSIRQAQKFMDEHYSERIGLDDVAGAAGVSKFHLARVFHAKIGVPIYQYLKRVRLAHALELLRAGVRATDVVSAGALPISRT